MIKAMLVIESNPDAVSVAKKLMEEDRPNRIILVSDAEMRALEDGSVMQPTPLVSEIEGVGLISLDPKERHILFIKRGMLSDIELERLFKNDMVRRRDLQIIITVS